jgi:hypothetical protein
MEYTWNTYFLATGDETYYNIWIQQYYRIKARAECLDLAQSRDTMWSKNLIMFTLVGQVQARPPASLPLLESLLAQGIVARTCRTDWACISSYLPSPCPSPPWVYKRRYPQDPTGRSSTWENFTAWDTGIQTKLDSFSPKWIKSVVDHMMIADRSSNSFLYASHTLWSSITCPM